MAEATEKELKVLRAYIENSDRARKTIAADLGMSESELSRITKDLSEKGIIKKFTVDVDYRKLGYPDSALFIFSITDAKVLDELVAKLRQYDEVIQIQEVFGESHDFFVRVMGRDNEHIRRVLKEISAFEEIKADIHTFTLIFALNYRDQRGLRF